MADFGSSTLCNWQFLALRVPDRVRARGSKNDGENNPFQFKRALLRQKRSYFGQFWVFRFGDLAVFRPPGPGPGPGRGSKNDWGEQNNTCFVPVPTSLIFTTCLLHATLALPGSRANDCSCPKPVLLFAWNSCAPVNTCHLDPTFTFIIFGVYVEQVL